MHALYTDLYELRMAAVYLRRGMTGPATFSLFVRHLPPHRGFLVAAGLADALTFLEAFEFDDEDLSYLARTGTVPRDLLEELRRLRFTGDIWAVPEGRVVFAGEPLLEVTAPIAQAQLVETAVLNVVTHQTAVASKAARCRIAAGNARLVDFSFRRTPGLEAGVAVTRAAAIAGFDATSNAVAAARHGLVAAGTMAHSFVEAFPTQRAAFDAFAAEYPAAAVYLVDTYDTQGGIADAIVAARAAAPGRAGVRIDSGDLAAEAVAARQMLDDAGLDQAEIMVSGGLDEYAVERIVTAGAPVDAFGVGTAMGVSADSPSLDSAYKLVQYGDRPVMKLSPGKATWPGPKQVFRGDDTMTHDLVGLRVESSPKDHHPLLLPVMRDGRRTGAGDEDGGAADLGAARRRCARDLAALPPPTRALLTPMQPVVRFSVALSLLRDELVRILERPPART